MLFFVKAILGLIVLAVILVVSWPYLEAAFPNTTGAMPDVIQEDVRHIGGMIGEQAGIAAGKAADMAYESLSDAAESAAESAIDSVTDSLQQSPP